MSVNKLAKIDIEGKNNIRRYNALISNSFWNKDKTYKYISINGKSFTRKSIVTKNWLKSR